LPNLIKKKTYQKLGDSFLSFWRWKALKVKKHGLLGSKIGNFSQKRLKWVSKLTNMEKGIESVQNRQKIITITPGVTQGAPEHPISAVEEQIRLSKIYLYRRENI
jgi:hypothetical protein